MAVDFFYPAYEVVRNQDRCITCRVCERQCAKACTNMMKSWG